jgi:hypothetical protein
MTDLTLKPTFVDRGGSQVYDVLRTETYPDGLEFATTHIGQARLPVDPKLDEMRQEILERDVQIEELESQIDCECVWTLEQNYDDSVWEAACGESWCFTEGDPDDNRVQFCQGCGGKVVLAALGEK